MTYALGSLNSTINLIACSLFLISTLIITFIHVKYRTQLTWTLVAGFDLIIATTLIYTTGGFTSDIYTFYYWGIFECAFFINWRAGLVTALVSDVLYAWVVLLNPSLIPSLSALLIRLSIICLQSSPLLFIAHLEKIRHTQNKSQQFLITEKVKLVQELENINQQMSDYALEVQNSAVLDRLTNLLNQTYFHTRLMVEVEKARKENYPLSLVLFDIDNFKSVNDTYGHHCGDEVLQSVANRIHQFMKDTYFFAGRIGGEEFVIVMPNTPPDTAFELADELRFSIQSMKLALTETANLLVTVSGGVSSFPTLAIDAPHLTASADQAMYEGKRSGKNRVVMYQSKQSDSLNHFLATSSFS